MRRGSEGSGEGEGLSSLRAFAHSSSLHGISHVFAYGAVSLRRVLWGGFFLGSLGLLLLVCAERVAYFLTYPHVTKLDEVAARNLTFPAITICNLNEFRFSKITRNDMYHVGELLALLNERYEISNPQLAEPHVLAALRDKANFKNFKAKPFSMAEFYNRTGHDLADMLLQCSFRGTGCTARNFTVVSAEGVGRAPGAPTRWRGAAEGHGSHAEVRHWQVISLAHPSPRSTVGPCPPRWGQHPHSSALGAAGVPGGCRQCPGWSGAVLGTLCWGGSLLACRHWAGVVVGAGCSEVQDAQGYGVLTGRGCSQMCSPVWGVTCTGAYRCSPHHLCQPQVPLGTSSSSRCPDCWHRGSHGQLFHAQHGWGSPCQPCCDPLLLLTAPSTPTSSNPVPACSTSTVALQTGQGQWYR
ncbi:hypothetical protein DV515_00014957 [Chloebia gouldiae]|uniref:Acid-sensing ion channel 1 n=4 Tax=Passeriformes TaxID=9126 RepID=A0A3L8RWR6_CHLGU|nr:hypothetical protein DV515_00014957 [Chloebia gouldiae]